MFAAAGPPARVKCSIALWCARPDDMQPATGRRSSAVLKLGRYIVRCLTAQPDIWFLFLYKCGQLVAANLHEPVARSVEILDELFQAGQPTPPPRQQQQHDDRPATIRAGQSSYQLDAATGLVSSPRRDRVPDYPMEAASPDNDQYRGMDDNDTDEGDTDSVTSDIYTDSDDDPFVFLTGHRYSLHRSSSSGISSCRRSSLSRSDYSSSSSSSRRRRSTVGLTATTMLARRREDSITTGTATNQGGNKIYDRQYIIIL